METVHPFKVTQNRFVYQDYIQVIEDEIQTSTGIKKLYNRIEIPSAAVIVAETADNLLVIQKEYRHPTKTWLYGLPGGSIDLDENPLDAAKRELKEETGFEAKRWSFLGSCYPFPSVCSQKIHFFLAQDSYRVNAPSSEDPFECIEVQLTSLSLLEEEMAKGTPIDGTLLTGLYLRSLFFKGSREHSTV